MIERSPFVVVAALVLAMALSPDAWANCNAIPDAESAVIGGFAELAELDPTVEVPIYEAGLIGFKGALGRMDRIQLIPGHTAGFRIQPDGQCVQADEGRLIVRNVPGGPGVASDPVVSVLTQPANGGSVQTLVLAGEQECDKLGAGIKHEGKEPGVVPRCVPRPPELERPVGGRPSVRVRLPVDDQLRGPATVVLTDGLPSPDEFLALLSMIAADGCSLHCDALVGVGALGCIDRFYAPMPDGTAVHDPVPCEVTIPGCDPSDPSCSNPFEKNDFQAKCEDLNLPPADLAKCANNPTGALQLWEDRCGGVHIPFDWTKIRKDSSTTPFSDITRVVAGRSATSRTEKGKLNTERIWIPGREFMGSTPWADPQGTAATTDWRRPDIDVWYPEESPHELGLRGSTDGPDSIVHIFPRIPVSIVCKNGTGAEACMAVEGEGGVSCACRDRYPADCECEMASRARFYACDDGDFEGMPCTRHAHCNSAPGSPRPDGKCSEQPVCQEDGEQGVWQFPGSPPGTKCWDDKDCEQVAQHPWCGYRLFDVSDRRETRAKELRELDPTIDTTPGSRARRGVCKEVPRDTKCNNTSACPANKGPCRGYTLRAGGKIP